MGENPNQKDEKNSNPMDDTSEKLGQFLRKKRTSLKIDISELCRESKINVDYIRAIETDQFDELPGDAYIRAYLKTLAKRYNVDTHKILEWYSRETGQEQKSSDDKRSMLDLKTSSPSEQNKSKSKPVIFVIILIVIAAIGIFNMTKKHRARSNSSEPVKPVVTQEDAPLSSTEIVPSSSNSEKAGSPLESSVNPKVDTAKSAPIIVEQPKKADKIQPIETHVPKATPTPVYTTISFTCSKDSSWAAVRSTGNKTWAKKIRPGRVQSIRRLDTVYVEIGEISSLEMKLNGAVVPLARRMFKSIDGHQQIAIYNGKVID